MGGAFRVAVREQRQPALAGCAGQDYSSPPQSLAQARALAGLLLGAPVTGAGPWRHAIAGGQRTITLVEIDPSDLPRVFGAVDWPRPATPRKGTAVNRYQCTGRLVDDPTLKHTAGGKEVCEMRLAVEGMAPGNQTGFLNVSQFGPGGVAAANTLTKGWLVGFDGRLEHHTWKDAESGQNRQAYVGVGNVEFLAAPRSQNGERAAQQTAQTQHTAQTEQGAEVQVDAEASAPPKRSRTPPQSRRAVAAGVDGAVDAELAF